MELKDRFDRVMNYLYSYNGLVNNTLDDELIEEQDDLSKFMVREGEKAGNNMFSDDIYLENISFQNSILKRERSDSSNELLYDSAIKILVKNKLGYFKKIEYNTVS